MLIRLVQGIILGGAGLIPGLSGTLLAISFHLYDDLLVVAGAPWKKIWPNRHWLLPLTAGAVVGGLTFIFLLNSLLQNPLTTTLLIYTFLGLMGGSLPSLLREANQKGWRLRHIVWGILVMLGCLLVVNLGRDLQITFNLSLTPVMSLVSGFILGLGSIVPGLSGGFILINLGVYQDLMTATAEFDFLILSLVALGALTAIIIFSRLVTWLLKRFYTSGYYTFIGVTIASMLLAWPPLPASIMGVLTIFLFLLGVTGGYFLNRN